MSSRWAFMQLNAARLYMTWFEPFLGGIANENGAKLFVQSFFGPFEGANLTEGEQHCLRACMLLSIPPVPGQGGWTLNTSLKANLTKHTITELIGIVLDLASGNTQLRAHVQANRPVITRVLIPWTEDSPPFNIVLDAGFPRQGVNVEVRLCLPNPLSPSPHGHSSSVFHLSYDDTASLAERHLRSQDHTWLISSRSVDPASHFSSSSECASSGDTAQL